MTDENDEELLKLLKDGDCPAELIDLLEASQSKWRKGVIKQFIADHLWKKTIEHKLKTLGRENKAALTLLVALIALALKIQFFG